MLIPYEDRPFDLIQKSMDWSLQGSDIRLLWVSEWKLKK